MKTAIVYDRVNKWGGAERVLLALHELFPDAPLYTGVYSKDKAWWANVYPNVFPSFLQSLPLAKDKHEILGWLTPIAFEQFNFDKYDLVISVTSEAAKGIITKPGTLHICYCLTPTRYLWSHYDTYFKGLSFKLLTKPIVSYLRDWDKVASQRPDIMVAISSEVQKRIKKYYDRDAEIIYPPVETEKYIKPISEYRTTKHLKKFKLSRGDYYLCVSRLVPYKRVDLALEVFAQLGKRLVVVGAGSEYSKFKTLYGRHKNISLLGFVDEEDLVCLYKNAKAFLFCGEEDFGIVMAEAQAAEIPVITYKKGGAMDIVSDNKTGLFFDSQNAKSLRKAIMDFEKKQGKFDTNELRKNSERFSKKKFQEEFGRMIKRYLK